MAPRLGHLLPDDASEIRVERAWRVVGSETKAIADAVYPWDPAVVKAIHEFDPNVEPLFCKAVYRSSTGGIRVFGWHAIGSLHRDPRYRVPSWAYRVMRPASGRIGLPATQFDLHLKDRRLPKGNGLPGGGAYLPFDWRVFALLRSMYVEWTARQVLDFNKRVQEDARRIAREKAEQRSEDAWKQDERIMRPHFENIDQHDIARLAEPPEPKLMVTVP